MNNTLNNYKEIKMDNYLQLLPKDINNITEKYRIENNPNNKFLILLQHLNLSMFMCDGNGLPKSLEKVFKDNNLPIEIDKAELKIIGDLPFINDNIFKEILEILLQYSAERYFINWLLKKSESNFRVINSLPDSGIFSLYSESGITKLSKEGITFEIVTIKT